MQTVTAQTRETILDLESVQRKAARAISRLVQIEAGANREIHVVLKNRKIVGVFTKFLFAKSAALGLIAADEEGDSGRRWLDVSTHEKTTWIARTSGGASRSAGAIDIESHGVQGPLAVL